MILFDKKFEFLRFEFDFSFEFSRQKRENTILIFGHDFEFLGFEFEFLHQKCNFDFLPQNSNLNFRAKNGKNKYFEFYHKIQKISLKYFIDKYLIWIFSLKFTFMIYAI